MKKTPAGTWRKLKLAVAGLAFAVLSLFGGAAVMDSAVSDDVAPVEEEAGTWSVHMSSFDGGPGGGPFLNGYGGTWS